MCRIQTSPAHPHEDSFGWIVGPSNNVNPGIINPWLINRGCPFLVGIHHFWREHPPHNGTGVLTLGPPQIAVRLTSLSGSPPTPPPHPTPRPLPPPSTRPSHPAERPGALRQPKLAKHRQKRLSAELWGERWFDRLIPAFPWWTVSPKPTPPGYWKKSLDAWQWYLGPPERLEVRVPFLFSGRLFY